LQLALAFLISSFDFWQLPLILEALQGLVVGMEKRAEEETASAPTKSLMHGIEGYARNAMLLASSQLVAAKLQQTEQQKEAKRAPGLEPSPETELFAQEAVLHAIAEISETYIREMGKYSKDQAELSGRTQANLTDVLASLERSSITTQTNIRELAIYCMSEEVAFPQNLTGFPPEPRVLKGTKDALIEIPVEKENAQDGLAPKKKGDGPHMESWMPQLPPAYTYVSTVEQRNALKDGVSEQIVSKQRRQAEKELVELTRQSTGRRKTSPMSENPFLRPTRTLNELSQPPNDLQFQDRDREILEPEEGSTSAANLSSAVQGEHDKDAKRMRGERILATSNTVGD